MTRLVRFGFLALLAAAACASPRSQALELRVERSATIPTRRMGDYLVVDVAIDGREPVPLLLDTGAYHSSIDPDLAEALGATDVCGAVVVGWAGEVETRIVRAKTLDTGPLHVDGPVFTVVQRFEDETVEGLTGAERVRGILGTEMFGSFVLTVDYASPDVRFTAAPPRDDTRQAPLELRSDGDGRFLASIRLDDTAAWLLLDTGANDTVTVSEELARSVKLDPARGPEVAGVALGGGVRSRHVGTASVHIAGRGVRAPLYASRQLAGLDGRIGSGLLKFWTWVFDFRNGRMWAE
jgi:predicted aspartyl protease